MDEFSNLLAADTFLHGRLTNPTHKLWVHFETLHVIQVPSYASKFPPGPGLMMAFGQLLGSPLIGLVLSTALCVAAICWMLLAWVPPRVAYLGSLFALLHPLILTQSRQFMDPNLAVMGGACVVGGWARLLYEPSKLSALIAGLGVGILALVRPYEGAVLTLLTFVLWVYYRKKQPILQARTLLFFLLAIPIMTALFLGYYNYRITGNPVRMPYAEHEQQYGLAPLFWFQKQGPPPDYRHASIEAFHLRSLKGYAHVLHDSNGKLIPKALFDMLYGRTLDLMDNHFLFIFATAHHRFRVMMLGYALIGVCLFFAVRMAQTRMLVVLLALCFLAMLLPYFYNRHYSSPFLPISIALIILLAQAAWRSTRRLPGTHANVGQLCLGILLLVAIIGRSSGPLFLTVNPSDYGYERAKILNAFSSMPNRQIIFVKYGLHHDTNLEWVYNSADIDGSHVVWVRDMGTSANQEVVDYFKGSAFWSMDADVMPVLIEPYLTRGE